MKTAKERGITMTLYNIYNTQLVWRGLTLQGFSDVKINTVENTGSNKFVTGIAGEFFKHPDTSRQWKISSAFSIASLSLPILEQDNLNRVEDTLIVRDLNTGLSEIYTNCTIESITCENNYTRSVQWHSPKKNGR